MHTINSRGNDAKGLESMATNLAIGNAPKIMKKRKKAKRKTITMIKNLMIYVITVVRKGILVGIVGLEKTAVTKILRKRKEPLMEMS